MLYALIQDGAVKNIIAADAAFADAIRPQWQALVPAGNACIGWAWDGTSLLPPVAPALPPAPRHISVGAFFDRFGALKWAILAAASPLVQAIVKDASVRKYIDLGSPDLPAGLALLVAAGHAIDGDAVIDAPVQPGERP